MTDDQSLSKCTNIHIITNYFTHESRVLKETQSIASLNIIDEVIILALRNVNQPEVEKLDSKRLIRRYNILGCSRRNGFFWMLLRILQLTFKIVADYRGKKIQVVNCHSIFNLHIGVVLKFLTKCKIVYDAHELETEQSGHGAAIRFFLKLVERILIRYVDYTIVVSKSIESWYREKYKINNIETVFNVPVTDNRSQILKPKEKSFREKYNLGLEDQIFIYQGLLDSGRGIEVLLNVFSGLAKDKHIVFMGYGRLKSSIQRYEANYSNIHLHPPVLPHEVLEYTGTADVGLSFIENDSLSHYFCLPNKIFEYTVAGLPSIVSDFPEMASFVDRHQCGWKVNIGVQEIRQLIRKLEWKEIADKKEKAKLTSEEIGWHLESVKIQNLFKHLLYRI